MSELLFTIAQFAKRADWADYMVRYGLGHADAAAELIACMSGAGESKRRDLQAQRVAQVLRWAKRAPYGRGRGDDPSNWPVLAKARLRTRPSDFLVPWHWPRIPAATSGTTGEPLRVWRSLTCVRVEQLFLDRLAAPMLAGLGDARVAVLRSQTPKGPGAASDGPALAERVGERRLWLSPSQLSADTLDDYLKALQAFEPDVLWVYPAGGDRLASLCLDRGLTVPMKLVLSSSEMLGDDAFERMQRVFRAPVVDYYGQAERVCLAARRTVGQCRFEPAYGLVELDPVDSPDVAPGCSLARIVATGFWNDVMPLVRYDTGDLIEHDSGYGRRELELVALGLLPFTRVIGREPGYLLTPDGARIQGLTAIVGNARRVRQAQFVQAADFSVEIRVLAEPGFCAADEAALMERSRQRIPPQIPVRVRQVDALHSLSSGKVPFIARDHELHHAGKALSLVCRDVGGGACAGG